MEKIDKLVDGLKPVLVMVIVQVGLAGMNVLYKLAASDGMSMRIIIAYRFIFATAFMVPLAFFYERNIRPKLTWTVFFQAFLSGLFGGTLCQNMYVESLMLTSVTFAAAMFNLVPAVTFILGVSFGLEKIGIRTMAGKAKVVGTLMGIGGAMLLCLYKGKEINMWSSHINLLNRYHSHNSSLHANHNYALGSLLAVANCFSYALWVIIQAKMSQRYPCPYSCTALMSLVASIQATAFALIMEKDWSQWKLGWNIRLLTVAYAGIIVVGMMVTLIIWCVWVRGPLFVSVFNPLLLVCTALAGSIFLDEKLHLGSILGGVLIVCGLYGVLWGKGKEMKRMTQLVPLTISKDAEAIEVVISSCGNESNVENNNKDLLDNEVSQK